MKILLTGALGFIGKNFLLHKPKNWHVTALDIVEDKKFQKGILNTNFYKVDLTDAKRIKALSKKINRQFDVCVYFAANGDPALSVPDPTWDLQSTTMTLINTGQNFKFNKILYLSSGAVYNGRSGLISPRTSIDPILPYAISHYASEQYAKFFAPHIVIRFFGAYGPYEPPRKIYTNLVQKFGFGSKKEFTIRGDGKNLIDAMYVQDAIAGFIKVIMSDKTNITIDFCKGEHPDINQLVVEAASIFDIDVKITHQGAVPEYNNFYASPREFEKTFGFRAKTPLKNGLIKLKKHLENV